MQGIRFWLLVALWPHVVALSNPLPHVQQYEIVWPQRLPGHRARRALPSQWGLYPENVSYILETGKHTFTLHLRKNRDLLGSGYTVTYSADNGSEVTEQLHEQDHCLYQGHVEGHQGSAASLSTCSGLRGFFQVGSAIHLIEPLDGSGEEGQHAVYQAEHLQQKAGTCGVSDTDVENILGPRALAAFWPYLRNSPLPQKTHYVELYVVTDSKELQLLGSREAVHRRVLEVVNHVDKLYQELNFRVVLVGLEIWSTDKFYISHHANVTLDNFLSWRARALTGRLTHDNVQLITGIDFAGTTVGLAKVSGLCSWHSGAVNQDHTQNPIGVASTMAHELGHNLGMSHDEAIQGCYCPVPQEGGGCIMAGSLGSKFPRMFSRCSRDDLETFLERPEVDCLANAPDLDRLVGGPVCGNLFVERGEQCDCGTPQDCQNRCCNATTCQLAEEAECAHGDCCHECKVKPAGELCRHAKDGCDLKEFCDGQQPMCPEDAFQENGIPCPGGYCFDGNCPTMAHRCKELWGLGAWPATDTCFKASLSPGCSGSISFDRHRPNRCGVLYCEGGQKPRERSSCNFNSHQGRCQALRVDTNTATYELVLEGTKCDEGKVCWKGQCQDLQVYRSKNCSAKCHNHGVCNHKSECHCPAGWAPPHCAKLLVDMYKESGSLPSSVLVVLVLLAAGVIIVAGVIIHRKMWHHVQIRSSTPKTTMGLSNPLFHEGGNSFPAKGKTPGPPELISTTQASQFPKPTVMAPKRPPPAPPATMSNPPLPLPVYTQQASDQLRPAPPTKPLPQLKPKQGLDGTKVPLKPPVQRR
ncbi:disintegrin and metalloproteinase domain-containing protein 8 isoform X2 [Heterocephalus glaber]|uniref:Disintegrin and metalloproteinase domain-containing protein 8 isoform X2 n=1 Tax=Heterocephalus glaber TaxID=10181 RepID=A0AAX6SJN5_HETGA|nr:disintegrin and metalloproteinase domain-containing protein 8 isoform X2 [Heterocephalus glaber]